MAADNVYHDEIMAPLMPLMRPLMPPLIADRKPLVPDAGHICSVAQTPPKVLVPKVLTYLSYMSPTIQHIP